MENPDQGRDRDLHPELPLHGPRQALHREGVEAQAPQRVARARRRDAQLQQQLPEALAQAVLGPDPRPWEPLKGGLFLQIPTPPKKRSKLGQFGNSMSDV